MIVACDAVVVALPLQCKIHSDPCVFGIIGNFVILFRLNFQACHVRVCDNFLCFGLLKNSEIEALLPVQFVLPRDGMQDRQSRGAADPALGALVGIIVPTLQ